MLCKPLHSEGRVGERHHCHLIGAQVYIGYELQGSPLRSRQLVLVIHAGGDVHH